MPLTIETEQEEGGRWIAEVLDLPGVLTYGQTRQEAIDRAQALALRVLADRLEHGGAVPPLNQIFVVAPDPALLEPRDEWERNLRSLAKDCGVSLSDLAVSSEGLYD